MQQANLNKKEWRNYIREQKMAISSELLTKKSAIIFKKLEEKEIFKSATTVMLYYSLPDEVQTADFIQKWIKNKRILLPLTIGKTIYPVEISKNTQFKKGDFGVLEPQKTAIYSGKIDLIVVPGVAFDKNNNRLGRGKGCYDSFLAQNPETYKIGICYDFQFVEKLPIEPHDIAMNEVIFG